MNPEAVKTALASLKAGEDYYAVECPKCRRINKITVKQLEHALPRTSGEQS
jgi:phage FluMu protein Com